MIASAIVVRNTLIIVVRRSAPASIVLTGNISDDRTENKPRNPIITAAMNPSTIDIAAAIFAADKGLIYISSGIFCSSLH